MSVVFRILYFVDNYMDNDMVTLKRANTNAHIHIREMYTKEIKVVEEDTG